MWRPARRLRACRRAQPSPATSERSRRAAGSVPAVRLLPLAPVLALVCCATAHGAPLVHEGTPEVAGPKPTSSALQRLQAYPRALVELDRARGAAAVPALRRAGGELISPPLSLWRLPSWTAQRTLPALLRRGLVRPVTPDLTLGPSPLA